MISGIWNNEYILTLGIKDHIRELKSKDDYMKAIDLSTTDDKTQKRLSDAYDKELMDLYLLLEKKFSDYKENLKVREREEIFKLKEK